MIDPLTPYTDVNEVLRQLLAGVRDILRRHFVGMYLYGSLAIGDFAPDNSDIDFVVVTDDDLTGELSFPNLSPRVGRLRRLTGGGRC